MHDESYFVTLTYDERRVPLTLQPRDCQNFLKRLRRRVDRLRFFCVGEYGDRVGRPHYHALLFGARLSVGSRTGKQTFESPEVSAAWKDGMSVVGRVTPASASYVAGYCAKKFARGRFRNVELVDPETGEVVPFQQPFARMSLRPAIGVPWLERFGATDVANGYVVCDGQKLPVPRYYSDWFRARYPLRAEELEQGRAEFAARVPEVELMLERRETRARFAELRHEFLLES